MDMVLFRKNRQIIVMISIMLFLPATGIPQSMYRLSFVTHNELLTPNFSPDGRYVAFLHRESAQATSLPGLYVVELARPDIRKLLYTAQDHETFRQVWFSRDSKSLAYSVHGSDNRIVHVSLSSFEQTRLTPPRNAILTFSPGFRNEIVYSAYFNGDWDLYRVVTDGTDEVQLTSGVDIWQFYSRSDRDWVLYSTRRLGTITRIPKAGGPGSVLADLGAGDPIFKIASNGSDIVFTRTSHGGGDRVYRYMDIEGQNQFDLSNPVSPTNYGWLDGNKGKFLLSGNTRVEDDPPVWEPQVLQFDVRTREDSQLTLPTGLEAHPPAWLTKDNSLVFGVGAVPQGGISSLYYTDAIWSLAPAGDVDEVYPPIGHKFHYHMVGRAKHKVVITPATRVEPEVEPYLDLFDLEKKQTTRLSNLRAGFCHSYGNDGMLILEFADPNDQSTHRLRYRNLLTDKELTIETNTGSYSEIRLEHHCSNPYDGNIFFFRRSVHEGNETVGYEYFLLGFPYPEESIVSSTFEMAPRSTDIQLDDSTHSEIEANEPHQACVEFPGVVCPSDDHILGPASENHTHWH